MNKNELKMVDLLKELKEKYSVFGVKGEFEAEGARLEELMRLKEISLKADLTFTLKIGGCEAVRDMYDARLLGVDHLVAPMIESPYALKKYLKAVKRVFSSEERESIEFLFNVETIDSVENLEEILKIQEIEALKGIVIGRVDLTGSMNKKRAFINSDKLLRITKSILTTVKRYNLTSVLGGGISLEAMSFLESLPPKLLDRLETRKICFLCPEKINKNIEHGIRKAVEFELLWLKNKRNFYNIISEEDKKRIHMLEERR